MKINSYTINDVTYKHVKFDYEILCDVGYTKIAKSNKFVDLNIYILLHLTTNTYLYMDVS
jgi:hypothetical protein